MTEVNFGELMLRMIISLVVVLGVVLAVYAVLRRRQGLVQRLNSGMGSGRMASMFNREPKGRSATGASPANPSTSGGSRDNGGRGRSAGSRSGLKVIGRSGLGRASSVVVVQFGDSVLLLGANDTTTPVVLSEMPLDRWQHTLDADNGSDTRAVPYPIDPAHLNQGAARNGSHAGAASAHQADQSAPRHDANTASLGLIEALREATARRG